MRIFIALAITVSICGGCASSGRYQVIPLERAESAIEASAILLDTATGETWRTSSSADHESDYQWAKMTRE